MAKSFAPRVSKKERKVLDYTDKIDAAIIQASDDKLLKGAKLNDIKLVDIIVKDQVRTKFNDKSIKELAENIEANGLIQPLVVHRVGSKYTLICGERRFRAMSSIPLEEAPCFVLDKKSKEELMAIQFSENSSREELHWIDKADGILNYQLATKASERKIVAALGISKSEVHRSLLIGKLSKKLKEAAKVHDIEKYVLLEFDSLPSSAIRKTIEKEILSGKICKRSELKKAMANGGVVKATKKSARSPALPKGVSANAFLKVLNTKSKGMKLDKETKELLKNLVEETKDIVDMQ